MLLDTLEANRQQFGNPEWLYDIEGLRKGRIDIRVDSSGRWFHDGKEILRQSLIRLLEDSLLMVDGEIVLRAPEQLLRIKVEDCPFLIADFDVESPGDPASQSIMVHTLSGLSVPLDQTHPLTMSPLPLQNESVPVVNIRDGLLGRFSRNAFYRLVEWAVSDAVSTQAPSEHSLANSPGFFSQGIYFSLGN